MNNILKVRNVNDYGRYLGSQEQHPLVCVIDYAEVSPIRHSLNNYSVYGLFLRDDAEVELDYGCGKFDHLLRDYFEDKLQLTLGLPTVQYCADKLCMSPNYFGDVIKKTTGDTASNHIRRFVIQLAKNCLAAGETVSQVSDRLGFEYSQHFSRMFKKQEGITPSEYCQRLHTR